MDKTAIQLFLGENFVVKNIIEDERDLFAFYVSKKFVESGGKDKYILVGLGPFYFNKITGEKRTLGASEFHEDFFERKLIQDNLIAEVEPPNLKEVIEKVKKRKYINGDEFEIIINEMKIDHLQLCISSTDMINEIIKSDISEDIDKFRWFFEKTALEFIQNSPNQIILRNE